MGYGWLKGVVKGDLLGSSDGKESACSGDLVCCHLKQNWPRITAVSLPGKSHGQRSLEGYRP